MPRKVIGIGNLARVATLALLFLTVALAACVQDQGNAASGRAPVQPPTASAALIPTTTPTAIPITPPISTVVAPVTVRQSPLEIVSADTAPGDGGNTWGGHQTRIVRTTAGVFTTYTITGSDYLTKEWRLAWRKGDGTWPVIAQGIAGREPVNLLASPDGTLHVIGWPGGKGTIWSGKPANGRVQMQAALIPGVAEGNWPYGSAGIDAAGNLCVLNSNEIYDGAGNTVGGAFDWACYLPAQQQWVTKRSEFDLRYAYTYVFPQPNGKLSLISTRDVRWAQLGYQKPADAFDYVFNAFRYWRTTALSTSPLQVRSFVEEPQTAQYPDVVLNAQMDAYLDAQDRMHILYTRRGATTAGVTRFYHRIVAPDGTTLHDGEIQRNGDVNMGWLTRLFGDSQGRLYLISGYSEQLFPLGADGFTLGAPIPLNFGGHNLAYTGVALAVPRTGTAVSNVMDVVFGTADERKWIYFQLDLAGQPTPQTGVIKNGDFEAGNNGDWRAESSNGFDLIDNTRPVTPLSADYLAWLGGEEAGQDRLTQNVTLPNQRPLYLVYHYQVRSKRSNIIFCKMLDSFAKNFYTEPQVTFNLEMIDYGKRYLSFTRRRL